MATDGAGSGSGQSGATGSPGTVRLPPVGFWSYARQDEALSAGKLGRLRSLLMDEVQQLFGRDPVRLFQDASTIPHGSSWESEIRKAIAQSAFFVPVLTPNFVESDWCNRELELFLEREAEIAAAYADGAGGRIFPILYVGIDEAEPLRPDLLERLLARQAFDFRPFRHRDYDEPAVREALSELALAISRLLRLRLAERSGDDAPARTDPSHRPEPAATIGPGEILNHMFEVTRFIKAGGMGQVFEGRNVKTGERVAIKTLLPALAADPKVVRLFYREAETLTRLHHEAVVQYRVLAEEPRLGTLYIVTEYIDGVELSAAIGKRRPSPDEVVALARRLASGLAAAHRLGAVHRDVSIDNVMLPGGDLARARLIDFGIAKDVNAGAATILGPAFAGKLGFAAPEQLGDFGGAVGTWTDVYSLGLVLVAAARGAPVEMGRTFAEAVHKRREPIDLEALPEPLRPVVAQMLEPDPSARLRTMDAVLAAIDAGGAPAAAPPSPKVAEEAAPTRIVEPPIATAARPARTGLIAAGAGLVAVAAAAALLWKSPEAEQTRRAQDPPPTETGPADIAAVAPKPVSAAVACRPLRTSYMFFGEDQVAVNPMDSNALDTLAADLHPRHRVTVTGQSEGGSGPAAMARRRADAIADHLAGRGVARSRIRIVPTLPPGRRTIALPDPEARRYRVTADCL